ncbi:MAG TPA: tubulin-like doman-containing protein, partial [Anaerolineaceae bacterium]|nr:tubulin-like doman-containing protein [Anaerolineaceae bacterium]
MTRPGLIVGLGGTGQWVLTWLKRDLLLSNNGVMPKNVRLLEIDTCTQLEAKASRINAKGQKEEATEVGGVMLDRSEYVYIGGNAHELARQIKARQAKGKEVVYPWFHAAKWLSTQAPRTFVLDEGAGRLRQFGRLAVFKDMQGEEAGSSVWSALRTAIEGVRVAVNEQRSLEIIVVGSFAGGTGSGLFIDIALILRLLARQLGVNHILRGMFALPSVFTTNPDAEMKARSFAAWRELNRFMVVDEDFPMPEIRYVPTNPNFRIQPDQRLFDACYLVDGKRKGQPIAKEAKYGVFPMLAEFLSAILDEQAGTAYTQWIFTNLAPEYARKPET